MKSEMQILRFYLVGRSGNLVFFSNYHLQKNHVESNIDVKTIKLNDKTRVRLILSRDSVRVFHFYALDNR